MCVCVCVCVCVCYFAEKGFYKERVKDDLRQKKMRQFAIKKARKNYILLINMEEFIKCAVYDAPV